MAAAAAPRSATALQVQAWKKRMGYSITDGAAALGVSKRTFTRWMSGDSASPKWLGNRFRTEGTK